MPLERFPLDFATTLRGAMDATQVTIPLTSIAGLPTSGVFRGRIDDEIVYFTGGGLGTLDPTVVRGAEGTVAATHASAAVVESVITENALHSTMNAAGVFVPRIQNYKAWSFDPVDLSATNIPASGQLYLSRIPVQVTETFSTLDMVVATAGVTLTAGQNIAVLYDRFGTLLAQSADQTAALGTGGLKSVGFVTPVTVQGGPDEAVYGGYLQVGTTPAKFRSVSIPSEIANVGLTTSPPLTARGLNGGSGLTAPPATLPGVSARFDAAWVGLK